MQTNPAQYLPKRRHLELPLYDYIDIIDIDFTIYDLYLRSTAFSPGYIAKTYSHIGY